jgi:glycosyltransferase involved in cell wall biosynthesis
VRILYVTPPIGSPQTYGGEIRRWNVLQGLKQAGDIDALVVGMTTNGQADAFDGCAQVIEVSAHRTEGHRLKYNSFAGRGLLVLGTPLPFEHQGVCPSALRAQLQRRLNFTSYDVVWFAGAHVGLPLVGMGARATILDGGDFSYVRDSMLLRHSPWYGAKVWNYLDVIKLWSWERGFAKRFDIVVRCSDDDRKRHPGPNVVVIPNGTTVPSAISHERRRSVLFVGDLGYAPNTEGVEWFLKHVWPLVRSRVPDASLEIAGGRPSERVSSANGHSGVVIHGFVPDLNPLYRIASVSIAPLRAGSGTRLKILESLAREVPVVSTSIGAFGIEAGSECGLARADTPEEFAERCAAELLDEHPNVGRLSAGREFVRAKYDWSLIQRQVAELARQTAALYAATTANHSDARRPPSLGDSPT